MLVLFQEQFYMMGTCTFWWGRFVIPQGSKSVKAPTTGCQATEQLSCSTMFEMGWIWWVELHTPDISCIQEGGNQPGESKGFEQQR